MAQAIDHFRQQIASKEQAIEKCRNEINESNTKIETLMQEKDSILEELG